MTAAYFTASPVPFFARADFLLRDFLGDSVMLEFVHFSYMLHFAKGVVVGLVKYLLSLPGVAGSSLVTLGEGEGQNLYRDERHLSMEFSC
jgi:hypothetical protein